MDKSEAIKEYEANVFAVALLLPEQPFRLAYEEMARVPLDISCGDEWIQRIKKLARKFKVSTNMVVFRLIQLNMLTLKAAENRNEGLK